MLTRRDVHAHAHTPATASHMDMYTTHSTNDATHDVQTCHTYRHICFIPVYIHIRVDKNTRSRAQEKTTRSGIACARLVLSPTYGAGGQRTQSPGVCMCMTGV